MSENGVEVVGKRRSSQEVERLVREFESSGLRPSEFCRQEGLALSTLRRRLGKRRGDQCGAVVRPGLIRVEWPQRKRAGKSSERCALEVELGNGRKIAVWPDFEVATLTRLLWVLEKA